MCQLNTPLPRPPSPCPRHIDSSPLGQKQQRPPGHQRNLSLTSLCASDLPVTCKLSFYTGAEVKGSGGEDGG